MRSKLVFIAGAGLGYVLGTRAGRQQFEKIKGWSRSVWQDPRVQAQVNDFEARATDFAKTEGAALKDKVTDTVKSVVGAAKDTAGSDDGASTGPASPYASPPGSATRSGDVA